MSQTQFAVSRVACKAIHWQATEGDSDRNSHMAIEWTLRSTIEPQAQAAESVNVQPLALAARGAGKAFHASRKRTAGSAKQFALSLLGLLVITFAVFGPIAGLDPRFEAKISLQIGFDVQMRIIYNFGAGGLRPVAQSQFAVSRVACKAIHWHPTEGDSDRNSHMAIEWTLRSTIEPQAQAAETFEPAGWGLHSTSSERSNETWLKMP